MTSSFKQYTAGAIVKHLEGVIEGVIGV